MQSNSRIYLGVKKAKSVIWLLPRKMTRIKIVHNKGKKLAKI